MRGFFIRKWQTNWPARKLQTELNKLRMFLLIINAAVKFTPFSLSLLLFHLHMGVTLRSVASSCCLHHCCVLLEKIMEHSGSSLRYSFKFCCIQKGEAIVCDDLQTILSHGTRYCITVFDPSDLHASRFQISHFTISCLAPS